MAFQINLQKIFHEVRGPKGFTALTEELQRLKGEVQKLRSSLKPEAEAGLKRAQVRFRQLQNLVKKNQKQFESEIKATYSHLRKQVLKAEKDAKKIVSKKRRATPRKKSRVLRRKKTAQV
ncbi:MAG: hypothetical protein WCH11_01815 [Bdellovibrio sp.]